MAFAQKASSSATSYTTMLCFSRANSIYDEYGVNLGCNLIGNWYTLKNFKIGSISAGGYTAFSGAIPIVCEITNNGNSWTYSHLRVYNGIIVGYVEYEDKYGVSHGCPADLAGYVYKRNCTVLRDHIFLKGRRAFKKVKTYLMKGYEVTQRMAQRAVSYYGWFKNSNLHQFMEKYGIEELQKYCKRRLSYLSKRNRAKEALAC